ncbi:MAG: peptide-methionine (S)-S-oxide reductase [Chthoniobacter sp.]|jgi:peptide-methionine (S)-S-oxide reductase|nr:peptide-methionine (S)-S-oxide reductase [Chthoniobacter sp.]
MKLPALAVITSLLFATFGQAAELQKADFAAGCFWCMEAIFDRVPGVTDVVSGYAGGHTVNPTYEENSTGKTGHAESIEVTYDPTKVTFSQLLDVYWRTLDPTDGRGVEPDFGSQYRPILFYRNDEQKTEIEKSKAEVQKKYKKPIAVEVAKLDKFYPAEEHHQNYVRLHPDDSYVRNVSIPRLIRSGFKP